MKITPTVGRVVWFYPASNAATSGFTPPSEGQPLAAIIAGVVDAEAGAVHLTVFDGVGVPRSEPYVLLIQEGDTPPAQGRYATWMPYQVGQAKKHANELARADEPKTSGSTGQSPTAGLTFGTALTALKTGQRVARAGWNGKGMWLAYTPGSEVLREQVKPGHALSKIAVEFPDAPSFAIGGHIDMRAADGTLVVGWLASQTDMLAEDWQIVE